MNYIILSPRTARSQISSGMIIRDASHVGQIANLPSGVPTRQIGNLPYMAEGNPRISTYDPAWRAYMLLVILDRRPPVAGAGFLPYNVPTLCRDFGGLA